MTEFERAVLTILMRASEPLGWYQIEQRLSTMALAERPNLLQVLAKLRRRGFLEEVDAPVEANVRHALTSAGRAAIGGPP